MSNDDAGWTAFLAAIVDHIAHPVFVKDRAFRFVFLNRALCQMVGHSRDAMLGKTDYDFFPKSEADFFRKKDQELFETAADIEIGEEPMTDAAGGAHVLATTKVPLRNAAGQVTHLVGIVHDITVQKRAEAFLRTANEELERRVAERTHELAVAQFELMRKERLAVLGRMVGGLAHQIRNPLGAIINAVAILSKSMGPAAKNEEREALAVINEEAWRANRIIVDLIDFARIRPPEPRDERLALLVSRVLVAHEVPATIEVQLSIDAEHTASVDRDQVEGAIRNLVTNAVEAMTQGGTLSISSRLEDQGVVLTIQDSGPGIVPDVLAHLFEPLVTTKPFGLGLGLTTARSLVDNQGGRLRCVTDAGTGTRFDVWLPAQR